MTIRMSSHPPFGTQVILNAHEYVSRQAAKLGISLPKEGNCFTGIIDSAADDQQADAWRSEDAIGPLDVGGAQPNLTQIADTLCSPSIVGQLRQVCDRWLYSTCLHFGLPQEEQRRTRFHYDYSVFQVEYSRNLIFKRGQQLEQCFQAMIDRTRSRLDIKQVKTIFGAKRRPFWPRAQNKRPPREEVVIQRPQYDLTIFKIHFGQLTVKLYSKGARVLRSEAIVHNTKALKGKRSLGAFPHIVAELKDILVRFLNHLHTLDTAFIADDTLDTLGEHGQVGQSRTAGVDLHKPRLRAVIEAVIDLAVTPGGFTASAVAARVREILGLQASAYRPRHAAYDLKKLRGKQWVQRLGKSRRYTVPALGLRMMSALLILREKVIKPVLAGAGKPLCGPKSKYENETDKQYRLIHGDMRALLLGLGVAV